MRRSLATGRLLALVLLSACWGPSQQSPSIRDRLGDRPARVLEEAEAMHERHELRESLRARGLRVCEEGEWPQLWRESCNTCSCDAFFQVRSCTKVGCRADYEDDIRPRKYAPIPPELARPKILDMDPETRPSNADRVATYRLMIEVHNRYERHQLRETLRRESKRFCEEGEWPQEWQEDCNACWCDEYDQVRSCTLLDCPP